MPDLLLVSDAEWIIEDVAAVVVDDTTTLRVVHAGLDLLPAALQRTPDLVILDQQVGNMGGMAACLNLRLEEGADRLPHVPVLMLLDREADIFLAKRTQAEGWILKPLDAIRLRKAVRVLLDGGEYHEGSAREVGAGVTFG